MNKRSMSILLVLAMFCFMTVPVSSATEFSDMPNDWSTPALQNAVGNGLIIGDGGMIRPDDNMTRAQMAAIVNRAFGAVEKASLSAYTDVAADAWYYDEMSRAVQMKTFVGSGDRLYPDSFITREEAFIVLARAFKLYGAPENTLERFSDKAAVSRWAVDGVASLAGEGYIAGSYGRVDPQKPITRAEFAQMMDNLLKNYVKSAGVYIDDFDGNVMINVSGVTLKNLAVGGDLIIGDGAGDGRVVLDGVSVEGRTVVRSRAGSVAVTAAQEATGGMDAADFFPIKENVRYIYEGIGNEYASYNTFNDYTASGKIQQRLDNGGTVMAIVSQLADGMISTVFSQGETYFRENFLKASGDSETIKLMEPIRAGTSWILADGSIRAISSTAAVTETPSGSYVTVAVVTEGQYSTITDYYAKDMGLVKSVFVSEGQEISSSLAKIEVNAARNDRIDFYYPNIDDGKLYFASRQVGFHTNDVTGDILASAYKQLPNAHVGKVFSPNVKINSLSLDPHGKAVIDLNTAFVAEMNAGAQYEAMILQSVANTIGGYYGVSEVIITIEGRPYASGHEEMAEGQSITVDADNAVEIR